MMRKTNYRQVLGLALLALVISVVVCCLRRTSTFSGYVEMPAYDFLTEKTWPWETGHPDILLVTMSEETFWRGLNDENLALLIRQISSAGASAIAVDLIRDNPLPPGSEMLREAITGTEGASVFMVTGMPGSGKSDFLPPPFLRDPESLLDHVGLAAMPTDAPGRPMIRRGLVAVNGGSIISLPAQAAVAHLASTNPDGLAPLYGRLAEISDLPPTAGGYADANSGGNQFLLKSGPELSRVFPFVAAESISRTDADTLRKKIEGKIVFIGTEGNLSQDEKAVVGNPELRGIVLLATATAQLLRELGEGEAPIRWIPDFSEDLTVLLASVLFVLLFRVTRSNNLLRILALTTVLVAGWLMCGAYFLKGGCWLPVGAPITATLFSSVGCYAFAYLSVTNLFRRYRGREVADTIIARSGSEQVERTIEATAVFVDLKGYSAISERFRKDGRTPELLPWLNHYMETLIPLVHREKGFIDQFSGDGVFVVFGFPENNHSDHAAGAVRCALAIELAIIELNRTLPENLPRYYARTGIYTGPINCGIIGDDLQRNYSFLGPTVNKAARLESFNKGEHDHSLEPVRTLASDSTRISAGGAAQFVGIEDGPSIIDATLPPEVIWRVFPPNSAIPPDSRVIQP